MTPIGKNAAGYAGISRAKPQSQRCHSTRCLSHLRESDRVLRRPHRDGFGGMDALQRESVEVGEDNQNDLGGRP
jgi:hypothetical protein